MFTSSDEQQSNLFSHPSLAEHFPGLGKQEFRLRRSDVLAVAISFRGHEAIERQIPVANDAITSRSTAGPYEAGSPTPLSGGDGLKQLGVLRVQCFPRRGSKTEQSGGLGLSRIGENQQ